jgi:hypothetical protein
MFKQIKNKITESIIKRLEKIGSFINQNPPSMKRKTQLWLRYLPRPWATRKQHDELTNQSVIAKKTNTKAKGSPHADTKIFNHPRR